MKNKKFNTKVIHSGHGADEATGSVMPPINLSSTFKQKNPGQFKYEYARTNGHTNSAIKALELLSRIRGTQEEKEDMTDPVKLKEDLVKSAKIMGKDFYFDIAKEAGFLDRGNKVDNVDNKEHKE